MKKQYVSPKAEKIKFEYTEAVVASSIICESGLKKVYKDTGKTNCEDTYLYTEQVWNGDNLA